MLFPTLSLMAQEETKDYDAEYAVTGVDGSLFLQSTEELHGSLIISGVIAAEKDQIGTERIDPRDQMAQIRIREPETVMNITQIDNTEIVGFLRKVIRPDSLLLCLKKARFQQRIAGSQDNQHKKEYQPAPAPGMTYLMPAAAEGGRRTAGSGGNMLSTVRVHFSSSPYGKIDCITEILYTNSMNLQGVGRYYG